MLHLKTSVLVKLPASISRRFLSCMVAVGNQETWMTGLKTQKKMKRITQDLTKLYVCVGLALDVWCAVDHLSSLCCLDNIDDMGWVWPETWDELLGTPPAPMPGVLSHLLSASSNPPRDPPVRRLARVVHTPLCPKGELGAHSSYQRDACRYLWRGSVQKWEILQPCSLADETQLLSAWWEPDGWCCCTSAPSLGCYSSLHLQWTKPWTLWLVPSCITDTDVSFPDHDACTIFSASLAYTIRQYFIPGIFSLPNMLADRGWKGSLIARLLAYGTFLRKPNSCISHF